MPNYWLSNLLHTRHHTIKTKFLILNSFLAFTLTLPRLKNTPPIPARSQQSINPAPSWYWWFININNEYYKNYSPGLVLASTQSQQCHLIDYPELQGWLQGTQTELHSLLQYKQHSQAPCRLGQTKGRFGWYFYQLYVFVKGNWFLWKSPSLIWRHQFAVLTWSWWS